MNATNVLWSIDAIVLLPLVNLVFSVDPPPFKTDDAPGQYGRAFEQVAFPTEDDLILPGWFIPAASTGKSCRELGVDHGQAYAIEGPRDELRVRAFLERHLCGGMKAALGACQKIRVFLQPAGQVIVVAVACSAIAFLSACASPVEGLWPPSPDSPTRTVVVSLNTWHAMIAFQVGTPDASRLTRMTSGVMPSEPGIWKARGV